MIIIYISGMRGGHQTTSNNQLWPGVSAMDDLHQLNVKQLQTIRSATLNTGQPHVNEEQNPQNNNPQHPLSNK